MNSIVIPTIKPEAELSALIAELRSTIETECKIIVSSSRGSVSYNSNRGLERAKGEFILKVDDDVYEFKKGWDRLLIEVLKNDTNCAIVSARVLNPDGTVQNTCSQSFDIEPELVHPPSGLVPFCCVAFRNDGMRFDEQYIGSSFDDTDFNFQYRLKNPDWNVKINNRVTVRHRLESKNSTFGINQEKFIKKWKGIQFPDGRIYFS